MTRTVFKGINGSNPLGFMASVGLLRLLHAHDDLSRLGFTEDGAFHAWIECDPARSDIPGIVAKDAEDAAGPQPWRLEYQEKGGLVADLKAPPEQFSEYLNSSIEKWLAGQPEQSEYAAAYGTDVARDGNGKTKPTAFHFTSGQQHFLETVQETRGRITREWAEESLHDCDGKLKPGKNLLWDPEADRNRALMGIEPSAHKPPVNAPLEWLAFRGLPAFPSVPAGDRIVTCGVTGRRQNELRFHWPLWSIGASYATVRSLLPLTATWIGREEKTRRTIEMHGNSGRRSRSLDRLQRDLERAIEERNRRSVFAICTSEIRRKGQGYGSFGPAQIQG